jgi:hypothetical protein
VDGGPSPEGQQGKGAQALGHAQGVRGHLRERLRFPWELERQAWEVFCAAIEACTPVAMAA